MQHSSSAAAYPCHFTFCDIRTVVPKSNKLRYVHDQVADANYGEDINSPQFFEVLAQRTSK